MNSLSKPPVLPLQPVLQSPRIYVEFDSVGLLGMELERLKLARPLFVTDAMLVTLGVFDRATAAVPSDLKSRILADVPANPTADAVHHCIAAYRANNCDGIVAVGGGSVIDCAKAAAVLATNPNDILHYLGHPERIVSPPATLIAIPTTSGSGSEVSRGCGIHPGEHARTLGVNHPLMVPAVAIGDPALTLSLPPQLTAGTGLDALSHCIEGFLAVTDNPLVDAIALDGARRIVAYIERAVANGEDREARKQVMLGSFQGGLSITKGLGPAHAIANTCGDRGLHHGMLCAIALPKVLRLFADVGIAKIGAVADVLGCRPGQSASDALEGLNAKLGVPKSIAALGYGPADIEELTDDAANSFFNRASPYKPTRDEYRKLVTELMS